MNAAIDIRQYPLAGEEYDFDFIDEFSSITALHQDSIVLEIPDFVEIIHGQLNQIALVDDAFISDAIDDIPNGKTLIQAGTGFGKTKFVMESLTKCSQRLLMLVPSVAQVQQLASLYPSNDIAYLYGLSTAQPNDSLKRKHIIATFDKFPKIRKELGDELLSKEYMLIIDEIHKIWAAGSYRDGAINPMLAAIRNRNLFQKIGFLTATFTDELADLAQLDVDTKVVFTKENTVPRKVSIKVYEKADPYHWLQAVLQRVDFVKAMKLSAFVLVRLNSKSKQEALKGLYDELDIKALFINSDTMSHPHIQQALANQALPTDYDVIVTTSILDEALNFNNADSEIDSVHIVNGAAHPEEIIQFIGRFRKASPPVFIHLQNVEKKLFAPTSASVEIESEEQAPLLIKDVRILCADRVEPIIVHECGSPAEVDDVQQALDVFCRESYQSHVSQIDAENVAELAAEPADISEIIEIEAESYQVPIDECQAALDELDFQKYQSEMNEIHAKNFASINSYHERIKALCLTFETMIKKFKKNWKDDDKRKFVLKINQTCKEYLQCRFLSVDGNGDIRVNDASLLANCYRMDIGAVYSKDINYLCWRLQQLLPSIELDIEDVYTAQIDTAGLGKLCQRVKHYEYQHDLRLQNALNQVSSDTVSHWMNMYRQDTLEGFGKKQMYEQDQSVMNIYASESEPDHHTQYERFIRLTLHLDNVKNIHSAIKNDHYEKVLGLSADYRNNAIVQHLQRCIQTKWNEHKQSNGHDQIFRIDRALAFELVNEALALAVKEINITVIFQSMPNSGIKCDEKGQLTIKNESRALNMICKYCHVVEFNSNKPDKRYLILKGLYFGNYGYLCETASRSQTCPMAAKITSLVDL